MPIWLKEHTLPRASDDDSPARTIPLKQATSGGLLGLLLGVTATAIGALVSWWLVPPYLLVMVWLLLPEGWSVAWKQEADPPRNASDAVPAMHDHDPPRSATRSEPAPGSGEALATAATSATSPAMASEAVALKKPRRKRASRKPRATVEASEPAAATWVQVGPGRFVRVEVAEPPTMPSVVEDAPAHPVIEETPAQAEDVPLEPAEYAPEPEPVALPSLATETDEAEPAAVEDFPDDPAEWGQDRGGEEPPEGDFVDEPEQDEHNPPLAC